MKTIDNLSDLFSYIAERVFYKKYILKDGDFYNCPWGSTFPVGICCVVDDLWCAGIIPTTLRDAANKLINDTFAEDARVEGNCTYFFGESIRGDNDQRVWAALLLAEISR